jgi:signal transduction histidine kinase
MNEEVAINNHPKCLIVDDLNENIVALSSLLQDEEVDVHAAHSGYEALELMLKNDFALALVDVQMPEMDGFQLAEIMRSTEKTKSIPIIFVTAATTDVQRIFQGYEAGAVDFLHKPLFPQIVLSKVRIFLELYNQKVLLQKKLMKIKETESYLQRALESRDEFLSICSHELKTPLTSLKMQIQLNERMKNKLGEEKAFSLENMKKFIDQADRSVERIIHLVNDMLDISRVSTGRLSLNLEEVNLSTLAKEVTDRLMPIMEMAGNKVGLELEENLFVNADKFRIEQVLTNLLMNAAKYAPDSPVEIILKKIENCACLSVKDHGKGISEEDQKRIFERFERAIDSHVVSGLGLGLFISKEIMALHKGVIKVESELGKGATFIMKLPLED